MRDALVATRPTPSPTAHRPGALLLYDEAHLLADDRSRERYPLSSLLAALGAVQRSGEPRVRDRPHRPADPEHQPEARPNVRRADVPPRRAREPRARRCLGRAHDPARPNLAAIRDVGRRRDRRGDRRLSVLPAVLRRLSLASRTGRRGRPRPPIAPSNLRSCTNSTWRSSRTGSRGRRRRSRPSSSRWRGSEPRSISRPPPRVARPGKPGHSGPAASSSEASSIAPAGRATTSPCRCSAPTSAGAIAISQNLRIL